MAIQPPTQEQLRRASYATRNGVTEPSDFYAEDEVWIPIRSIDDAVEFFYVSNYGRICDNKLCLRKFFVDNYSNCKVNISLKSGVCNAALVQRLVLENFAPVPGMKKLRINHINGNKLDNRLCNLEWVERKGNLKMYDPTQEHMQMSSYAPRGGNILVSPMWHTDEVWTPVVYPETIVKNQYYVSNYGRVYSCVYDCILRPNTNERGYLEVYLMQENGMKKRCFIHRLVLMNFNPVENMDELQVNHIDFNTTNNHISNIEWCTPQENIDWNVTNNRYNLREKHIPNEVVHEICKLLEQQNLSYKEIADIVGLERYSINPISFIKDVRYRGTRLDISSNYTW